MEPDDPAGHKRALLSLRSAFVLTLALLVALAAGGLLYVAHRSIALAVLGAGGVFAAAVTFFNVVIELRLAAASRRQDVTTSASGAGGRLYLAIASLPVSAETSSSCQGPVFRSNSRPKPTLPWMTAAAVVFVVVAGPDRHLFTNTARTGAAARIWEGSRWSQRNFGRISLTCANAWLKVVGAHSRQDADDRVAQRLRRQLVRQRLRLGKPGKAFLDRRRAGRVIWRETWPLLLMSPAFQ